MIGLYLAWISCVLVIIPFGLGLYSLVRQGNKAGYVSLLMIFAIWTSIELFAITHRGMNNHFWLNLNCILTTTCFVYYYSASNQVNYRWLLFNTGLYFVLSLVWFMTFGNIFEWSIPYVIISNIILVLFSGYSLIQLFNNEPDNLFEQFEFWIHTGVLVYFTCSLIYLSFFPILVNSKDLTFIYSIGSVHSTINIIANLIYSYAFICRIRRYKVRYSLQ
jgi:hypothetical protein